MGIKGLFKLIQAHSPNAIKEVGKNSLFARKVAVDASMALYQFLVAIRSGPDGASLMNEEGEVTSHLQGMFYRTLAMLDAGIKPVWVFDGKPPELKGDELDKRRERRAKAQEELKQAQDEEDQEQINKFTKRLVRVTPEHNEECKRLLRLMGCPVVDAPSEAEAQCSAMAKAGLVYACVTEDMDALTFATPKLVRNLLMSPSRKLPIYEIDLATVLEDFGVTMEQFVDLCILCGCDYVPSIRGIGPVSALKLIKKHNNIEGLLAQLDPKKFPVPEDFHYKEARRLFLNPEVAMDDLKLSWKAPDKEGLVQFLVGEKGFQESRVLKGLERMKKATTKSSQMRIESFFGAPQVIRRAAQDPSKSKKGAAAASKPRTVGLVNKRKQPEPREKVAEAAAAPEDEMDRKDDGGDDDDDYQDDVDDRDDGEGFDSGDARVDRFPEAAAEQDTEAGISAAEGNPELASFSYVPGALPALASGSSSAKAKAKSKAKPSAGAKSSAAAQPKKKRKIF